MALVKTLNANGSKGHHKFSLRVSEDNTSGNSSITSFTFTISPIQNGYDWSGWGSLIPFSITIGSYIFTGTIPAYNGTSVVTLKSGSDIEIVHDSDGSKTINIGFSVSDTTGASYTCGNASASDTFKLSDLHKAPTLTITNLQEQVSGISADLFVRWVSIKTFTVSYSFYDSATPSSLKIYSKSDVEIFSTTTLSSSSGTLQISQFDIKESDVTNGKTSFILELTDSKGGKIRITTPDYNVTLYFKPSFVPTSSFVKRAGQTTGEAAITLIGSYFNDLIGSTQNSIEIKFDFWKTEDTEPNPVYYRYTIPLSVNTGTGNDIEITNWKLNDGNTTINSLDEEFSYIIGVTLTDNQTGLLSVYKFTLPKGAWLMAKFKDHVDFLNITVGQNPVVESGSDTNGSWIKYYDGTMICYGSDTTETLTWTQDSDIWYNRNLPLPNFPIEFISPPIVQKNIQNMNTPARHIWITGNSAPTTTNPGTYNLATYWNATGTTVTVSYVAIGKWK